MPDVAAGIEDGSGASRLVLATVFFGANDAVLAGDKQHVPVDEFRLNLIHIVGNLRSKHSNAVIILITPATVDSNMWPNRSVESVSIYAETVRNVAAELQVDLLDLWVEPHRIEMADLNDGLHFGESGNAKVAEGIRSIARKYKFICPEDNPDGSPNMKIHFPHHSTLGQISNTLADGKDAAAINYRSILDEWEW